METDGEIDPARLADGAGVPHGAELIAFVDAIIAGDDEAATARARLTNALGPEAMVDAAAVAANFFMMTRIADATGTPLDERSVAMSNDLRADLGIEGFTSKRLTGQTG